MKGIPTKKMISEEALSASTGKLMRSWRRLQLKNFPADPHRLTPDAPRFVDYAWNCFDPKLILKILTSNQGTYKALKPILFSGICTWVVCPSLKSLRQHGMLLVGIEHIRDAELQGRSIFGQLDVPNSDLLGDLIGRVVELGQDFYSDFYYPVGGISEILRSTSPATFRRSISRHSSRIKTIVKMMEIYDYHAKNLSDIEIYYQPSESKGYALVKEILGVINKEVGTGVDTSESRWRVWKSNAALIYSASTVKINGNATLLDAICKGEATFQEHGHLLATWIGRARHISEITLRNFTKSEVGRNNAQPLPDLPAEPTPEPTFTRPEQNRIEAAFNRATVLGNRRRTERQGTKLKTI